MQGGPAGGQTAPGRPASPYRRSKEGSILDKVIGSAEISAPPHRIARTHGRALFLSDPSVAQQPAAKGPGALGAARPPGRLRALLSG